MLDLSKLPEVAPDFNLEELFEAGMHFGHPRRKWHPKMAPYIYMEKNGVHIFDLEKTAAQLKVAYNVVHHLASQGKKVVVVGTKRGDIEQGITAESQVELDLVRGAKELLDKMRRGDDQVELALRLADAADVAEDRLAEKRDETTVTKPKKEMQTKTCSECGLTIKSSARFCSRCGNATL